jgi:uncharacterized protein YbaR (Trm112 family)
MTALDSARSAISLLREAGQATARARQMTVEHTARPPATGLVLDVGGGDAPHPRADCVVDRYVIDDFERGSGLTLSKPLVVADGQALPFADDAFDYVVASHVLEHATDPVLFAAELSRIGVAGFVQVPSREAELTFGWRFHPWLVDRSGDTLVFHPRGDAAAPLGEVFHSAMVESKLFGLWFTSNRDRWHHSIHWTGDISVEVHGESRAPQSAELDVASTLEALEGLAANGRVRGPEGRVAAQLRCPADRGALTFGESRLACESCGLSYPLVGGVPVLLAEAAQPAVGATAG